MILSACKPKSEFEFTEKMLQNIPDSVLNVDRMVDVMVDIHLAEAYVAENKADTIPQEERLKMFYAQVFAIHEIETKLYQNSYNYYVQEPVLMDHIYQKVTDKLNILEMQDLDISKQNKK